MIEFTDKNATAKDLVLRLANVEQVDPEIAEAIAREYDRQKNTLELIASENIVPPAVMAAQASVMTNK
ncbi:MAG: hypothetical protein ACOC0W_00530, partial [Desulfosalsimonas sp.]